MDILFDDQLPAQQLAPQPLRSRQFDELVPEPESEDYHGLRFLAAAYRTTRALLICKHLLDPGRSLTEAFQESVNDDLFEMVRPLARDSIFMDIAAEAGALPTIPTKDLEEDEIERLAVCHGFAALKLGYAPDDPCLHWFQKDQIAAWFPTVEELIAYDAHIVAKIGAVMVEEGRGKAFVQLMEFLGKPSIYERKDWAGLPIAFVRDFSTTTTEDDRLLMVARLENIAGRAQSSLDIRTELAAVRVLANVQGLTHLDDAKQQKELLLLLAGRKTERSLEAAKSPLSLLAPPKVG